jgi:hypothetical protein
MLNLDRILNQDRLTRAITGLNRKAFEELLPSFTAAYQQSLVKPAGERQRAPGGGRKPTLRTISEKLLYILLYCKCYPTFDLLSGLFNFDRSCAHDWVHRLLPILETTLGYKQLLPERQIRSIEEFLERFPDVREGINDLSNALKPQTNSNHTTQARRSVIPASTSRGVLVKSGGFF